MLNILKTYMIFTLIYHDFLTDFPFLQKKIKIDKCKKLACNLYDKKAMLLI